MFRILIVDDDRPGAFLLRDLMVKNLRGPHEVHLVWDGVEALDFLHRRGAFTAAPRPDLILLDINMPRLGGLETLSAIKNDPELFAIPVMMLSTSGTPQNVRDSYLARANCYVQKPTDLDRAVKLIHAVETFWFDFALMPPNGAQTLLNASGMPIAPSAAEARSRAMLHDTSYDTARAACEELRRLLDEFGVSVRELLALHQQQFQAVVEGDSECTRFDLLIHMANEKKQRAKYAYLRHMESHGCSNHHHDLKQTRA